MKKAIVLLAFLAMAGLCIWQARELAVRHQELRETKAVLADEQHARSEQAATYAYLERREQEWREKVMQLSSLVGNLRSSESAQASNYARLAKSSLAVNTNTADAGKGEGMFGKGMQEMVAKMMKDPNMRELMRAQQGAMVKMMYGPLIRDLNLPPEKQAKLSELLVEQQMKTVERSQAAFQEENADFKKVAETTQELQKENDAAIKALLGDEKFAEFQDSKQTIGERMQLSQLQQQMKDTGTPLQDDQTKQILAIIKEERQRHPPAIDAAPLGSGRNMGKMFADGMMDKHLAWQEELNRTVAARLDGILAPEQLKAYTEMQAQQLNMQKFGMKMAQEMFSKRATETAPDLPTPTPVP